MTAGEQPFCGGWTWLRCRVRAGRVEGAHAWMWRGYSYGAVTGAVEFGDAGVSAGLKCIFFGR